jgi:flagellar protein FliO/FliZ
MEDLPQIFRVLAAFAFVLALMGGFVIVLRKMGLSAQNTGGKRRLKMVEVLHIDSRRKVVIVQRDDKQHLLVLGPNSETVIETNIESAQDTGNESP